MSDIAFVWSSDEKDVLRSIESIGKAQGKLRDQIANLATASKEAGQVDNQLANTRIKSLQEIVEKQRVLKSQTDDLKKQLDAGTITADQYKAAFAKVSVESNDLTEQLRKLGSQVAEDTDDMKKARAVNEEYATTSEKVASRIQELNRLRDKGAISSERHAQAVAVENAKLQEGGVSGAKFGSALDGVASKLGAVVAGFVSVHMVVSTLRAEYENLLELQGKSASLNISLADAQEQAAFNLGEDPQLTTQGLFERIRKEAIDLRMDERALTLAVSDALSARGDASATDAISAVVAAAKLRRFDPSQLPGLSASALDISKGTGLNHEDALGFLLQVGTQSRVTDLDKLSKNVAPAIIGGMQFGASRQFAGATMSALTQGIVDPTGESSRTAETALLSYLRDFRPGQNVEQTFAQIIADPELRAEFLDTASFEQKAMPAIEGLLTGGSAVNRQFQSALAALSSEDPGARFRQTVSERDALPAAQIALLEQAFSNTTNQILQGDIRAAISDVIRRGLIDLEKAGGETATGAKVRGLLRDFETGGIQTVDQAIEALRPAAESQQRITSGTWAQWFRGRVMGDTTALETRQSTPEEQRVQDTLQSMLSALEAIRDQQAGGQQAGRAVGRRNNQGEAGP